MEYSLKCLRIGLHLHLNFFYVLWNQSLPSFWCLKHFLHYFNMLSCNTTLTSWYKIDKRLCCTFGDIQILLCFRKQTLKSYFYTCKKGILFWFLFLEVISLKATRTVVSLSMKGDTCKELKYSFQFPRALF